MTASSASLRRLPASGNGKCKYLFFFFFLFSFSFCKRAYIGFLRGAGWRLFSFYFAWDLSNNLAPALVSLFISRPVEIMKLSV